MHAHGFVGRAIFFELKRMRCILAVLAAIAFPSAECGAAILVATDGYSLFEIDTANPSTLHPGPPLEAGNGCWTSLALDLATSRLFSITCEPCKLTLPMSIVVREIDPATGATLRVFLEPLPLDTSCADKGVEPVASLMRVVDTSGANYRLLLNSEQLTSDTPLNPSRMLQGIAHRRVGGGFETYGISSPENELLNCELMRLGGAGGSPPASSGELTVIGSCGVGRLVGGFEISSSGEAFLLLHEHTESLPAYRSVLYGVDLGSGALTELGEVPFGPTGGMVTGIAEAPEVGVMSIPTLTPLAVVGFGVLLAALSWYQISRRREG